MNQKELRLRVDERVRAWRIIVLNTLETASSFLAFGYRDKQPVVLKVLRQPGDEWRCGEVLEAFNGNGTVRVYEQSEGAVLLERLLPGKQLADLALAGRDDEAIDILARVIRQMSHSCASPVAFVTVDDWGLGFSRYLESGDKRIPPRLIEEGGQLYAALCASQQNPRLLHGDLHHDNVLFDAARGWLAIDPKGVIGEVEYEIGASLRNPWQRPELFASPATVERRLWRFAADLKLDTDRALAWGFAQAVLSAIWSAEDGFAVDDSHSSLRLARAIRSLFT